MRPERTTASQPHQQTEVETQRPHPPFWLVSACTPRRTTAPDHAVGEHLSVVPANPGDRHDPTSLRSGPSRSPPGHTARRWDM
mgnify:CR=1 FL=1